MFAKPSAMTQRSFARFAAPTLRRKLPKNPDEILSAEEKEEEKEEKVINNPVLLATLDDVVSAEILKDLLTEAGILYSSDSGEDGTMKVTFGGSFVADDIYVDEQDFDAANTIYEEFLNSEPQFDEEFFEDAENEN